jgi:hypothetical protein
MPGNHFGSGDRRRLKPAPGTPNRLNRAAVGASAFQRVLGIRSRIHSAAWPRRSDRVHFLTIITQAMQIAPGWVRKGRNHDRTYKHTVAGGSRPGKTLCFLWRHPPGCPQFKSDLVTGVLAAGRHKPSGQPVSGLPPAQHGTSYRRLCQRPRIRYSWAISTPWRSAPTQNADQHPWGTGQAENLACLPFQAWANGHRNHL